MSRVRIGQLISDLPKEHVNQLHQRVANPGCFLDAELFLPKFVEVRKGERQYAANEFFVQIGILMPMLLEAVNEEAVARGQASQCSENYLRYKRIRCLPRFLVVLEWPIC